MKVLFMERKTFGNEDMLAAYKQLQYEVTCFPVPPNLERRDAKIEADLTSTLQNFVPDYVFSFNYLPIVATVCNQVGIPYLSWTYDSPYVMLYSYTVIYPCNRIFVFDKAWCEEFWRNGITSIHYLPLAANTDRLDNMTATDAFKSAPYAPKGDVAFIGALYNEKHQFFERMTDLSPWCKGYLEGIMAAQHHVYGYNFIESMLTPSVINQLKQALPMETNPDGVESLEYLFAQYVINRKLTNIERQIYLSQTASRHTLDLYTPNTSYSLPGAINHGPIDYYDAAPYVYKLSPISLNITLRSIHSGVPLRAFDIMGAGGFLLSNYQSDFNDFFVPGEDYAYYDSEESLQSQIDYYLTHEDERITIARNGHEKIKSHHTYLHRIREMESYL